MDGYPALTCLTCRVSFAKSDHGREHYKSEWHRYNLKRKVTHMEPISYDTYNLQIAKQQEVIKQKENESVFCKLCNKPFHSQNALENHMRSKKHREMEAMMKDTGISKSQMVAKSVKENSDKPDIEMQVDDDNDDSDVESWDGEGEDLGLEECLFCPNVAASLEASLGHMTSDHSFFLPDAEFICDLEGLIVYLGELISQGHMCLWCNQRSRLFRSIRDVQRHMVDKGHCKIRHDEANRHEYADFYDYRSSYPDADQVGDGDGDDESVDPELLITDGFQLVLPSGSTIGHRSLACYYKQNHGRRQQVVVKQKASLSKLLAGYRALGWTGATDAVVRQRARDVHFLRRTKQKYQMKLGMKANQMQTHYREQNPI